MAVSLIVKLIGNTTQFASSFNAAKKTMTSGVARMKSDWGKISPAITKVALATVGLGVASVKMASDYQKGIAEITTLMGEVAPAAVKKMSDEIKNLAMASGQALDKLTKARYDIVSAGFSDAADSAKLLEQATRTATAGVTDVSVAADVLTTAINAYGKTVDDAESISDTLFTTVRLGKTTMTELAGVMGHAIPIAAQAGVSLEELSASIAVLTARGQNTAEAVTAIRASVVELLKPSENLQKIYDALGISSGQALIEQYGFAGALKKVAEKAKELGLPLQDVFGNIRSMQAAMPLATDASDDLAKAMDEMETAAGATDEAYKKMAATFDFLKSQVMQSFKVIMIDIGETILPDVQKAFENLRANMPEIREEILGVAEGFKKVIEWTVEHGDLIKIIIGVGIAFKTASLGVVLFKLAINPVGASIAIVTGALLGLTAALKAQKEATDGIEVIESWADTYLEMADGAKTLAEKESALFVIEAQLANLRKSMEAGEITGADYIAESINVEAFTAAITKLKNEIISLQSVQTDIPSGKQMIPDLGEVKLFKRDMEEIEGISYRIVSEAEIQDLLYTNMSNSLGTISSAASTLANTSETIRSKLLSQKNLHDRQAFLTNEIKNNAGLTADEIAQLNLELKNTNAQLEAGKIKLSDWALFASDTFAAISKISKAIGGMEGKEQSDFSKTMDIAGLLLSIAGIALKIFGAAEGGIVPQYLAGGGMVKNMKFPVQHFGTSDTIPAMLTPGEAVITKSVVDRYGQSAVNQFAKTGDPSGLGGGRNVNFYIYTIDAKGYEEFLNGAGRQPTIEFIEKVSYRREL